MSTAVRSAFPHINQPTAIIIFGGTGDLAQTKLLPALYRLYVAGALPTRFKIIGLSRKSLCDSDYQEYVAQSIFAADEKATTPSVTDFCKHASYLSGHFDEVETYETIKRLLLEYDKEAMQCTSKLFYLAVPPQYYEGIFQNLHTSSLLTLCDSKTTWSRILVEKPFGKDLKTAQALETQLCQLFSDEQIYLIDHYLAKDAIENIIALRFANTVLSDSWSAAHVESISIKLHESKDVSTRGSFYDPVGALRDVGQNHILQILALLTMMPEDIASVVSLRSARAKVLQSLLPPTEFIKGQYAGYANTVGVENTSQTETYFKLKTELANEHWAGVPITLEAGKALKDNHSEVVVIFKPRVEWPEGVEPHVADYRNVLTIRFAPVQVITLTLWVKKPGFTFALEERQLELVHCPTEDTYSPEAYERVLYDCIAGDQTRFVSREEVLAAWQFISPLLNNSAPLRSYEPGSVGPVVVD